MVTSLWKSGLPVLIHTHRNSSYGRVQKHNTLQSALSTLCVLAGRGWHGESGWEEGLAPFLSLIETTSLMSKGNNLS